MTEYADLKKRQSIKILDPIVSYQTNADFDGLIKLIETHKRWLERKQLTYGQLAKGADKLREIADAFDRVAKDADIIEHDVQGH